MRKVFLDDLPRKGRNISWVESVGHKIKFIYDDVRGEIEIIGHNPDKKEIGLKYKDKEVYMQFDNFKKCMLGYLIGKRTNDFKIKIGARFKDIKRDIVITDRYYKKENKKNRKYYKYKCCVCGWREGEILEYSLTKGIGCSCCSNKTVVKTINSIYKTNSWMCDLGLSEKDAETHTYGSNKKVVVKCPECGKEKETRISSIYANKSILCECGDGLSFGEKCMIDVLNQLHVDYEREKTFDWSKNFRHKNPHLCGAKRYDFYLSQFNTICEVMGIQHYEEVKRKAKYVQRTLSEEIENDNIKFILSQQNYIDNYVKIDARKSEIEFIKESIMSNKEMNYLFQNKLNKIDWQNVEKYALYSNLKKKVCLYKFKNPNSTTTDIRREFQLSQKAVIKYLKDGMVIWEWAENLYNPILEKEKSCKKKNKNGKKVEIFNLEGKSLGIYNSCREIERKSEKLFGQKFYNNYINQCCRKELLRYKDYTFKYVE